MSRRPTKETHRWQRSTQQVPHIILHEGNKWKPKWDIATHLPEWLKLGKSLKIPSAGEAVGSLDLSHRAGEAVSQCSQCREQAGCFLSRLHPTLLGHPRSHNLLSRKICTRTFVMAV